MMQSAPVLLQTAQWLRGVVLVRLVAALALCATFVSVPAGAQNRVPDSSNSATAPRQRISIDAGWRFHAGDPEGDASRLLYDVRPQVQESAEGRPADAEPEEAVRLQAASGVLKPWILPGANAFIVDPRRRFAVPTSEPEARPSFARVDFDDSSWRAVNLPHDWAIEGPFLASGPYGGMGRLKSWGPVWYRKSLEIPAAAKGQAVFLDVDGAMSYASVWLNGRLIGGWPYGYASWRVDLTSYIVPGGRNQLAIRLDSPPESSRWYPGAGLYRNVWLIRTSRVHIGHWSTVVKTPDVSTISATVELATAIDNETDAPQVVDAVTAFYSLDADGRRVGQPVARLASPGVHVEPRSSARITGSTRIEHPRLWGPRPQQQPNRYVAVTTLSRDKKVLDREETRFGIRSVRFDANRGVIINGEPIPLQGANLHHDLGSLGAAFNYRAAERQLEMLQELGANAVRMAHNPPAPELLELVDRMGILVLDEIFDVWERKKTPLDSHLIFPDWHEADLRAFIRRDRNHPSVILWSVGNEVGEQYTAEKGAAVARELVSIAHEEDPTRPTTTAMNWAKADMPLPTVFDVIGLNYQGAGIRSLPGQFPAFRQRFPDKVILSTESAAALSSRGEFQFPVPGVNSASVRPDAGGDPETRQVSAYELFTADFGSSADRTWAAQDQNPYVAGEFVWSGWDYLGEPTPYSAARSSYFGIIDLAGFRKDRFYLYQSRWRPDLRFVHILPHWTWPERVGKVTPVHVFTSADEAELFVNGKSQGRRKKAPYEYRLRWDYVTYEPGEVSVVAYKDGKEWATSSVQTAGEPAKLAMSADRSSLHADGNDLSFITVRVTDAKDVTAPRASVPIQFTVEGPGEIAATDNGDPTSFESFQSPRRRAFNGLCLVVVRALPGQPGTIIVRANSPGIEGASIAVRSAGSATRTPQ